MISRESISAAVIEAEHRLALEAGRLSHSLFRGLLVLAFFVAEDTDGGVVDVARRLGMNASTTHRYMGTLLAFGLLVQDPVTRKYRLAT